MMLKMLTLYNQVKEVFVKPKIKFWCGLWKNDPGLPVWRNGPTITFYKPYQYSWGKVSNKKHKVYSVRDSVNIKYKTEEKTNLSGKTYTIDSYKQSCHLLPKGIKVGEIVWTSPIRRKLRKWHLDWIPPYIELPRIFSFHIFNWEVFWKTKYDDYRYEFPGQFTIVLFGISFSWYTQAPIYSNSRLDEDDYWESILNYIEEKGNLVEVNRIMGMWSGENPRYRFNPAFLKEPYKSILRHIQNDTKGDTKEL